MGLEFYVITFISIALFIFLLVYNAYLYGYKQSNNYVLDKINELKEIRKEEFNERLEGEVLELSTLFIESIHNDFDKLRLGK